MIHPSIVKFNGTTEPQSLNASCIDTHAKGRDDLRKDVEFQELISEVCGPPALIRGDRTISQGKTPLFVTNKGSGGFYQSDGLQPRQILCHMGTGDQT